MPIRNEQQGQAAKVDKSPKWQHLKEYMPMVLYAELPLPRGWKLVAWRAKMAGGELWMVRLQHEAHTQLPCPILRALDMGHVNWVNQAQGQRLWETGAQLDVRTLTPTKRHDQKG